MKKAFSILFLGIFLFNIAGYYIAFKTEQYEIRSEIESEIKAGVNIAELTTISISKTLKSDLQWTESEKEIRYKGEMYDVVKSSETRDSITYFCINDSKEATLFSTLNEHISQHIASNTPWKNSKKSTTHVLKLYHSFPQLTKILSNSNSETFQFRNSIFTSIKLEVNAPPPKLV